MQLFKVNKMQCQIQNELGGLGGSGMGLNTYNSFKM